MSRPSRIWRLNVRAAAILGGGAVALAVGAVGLYAVQTRRGTDAMVAYGRRLADQGQYDLARNYLAEAVARDPGSIAAKDLLAEVLFKTARTADQVAEAARLGDQVLRADPSRSPARQATRRRQVGAYLRMGGGAAGRYAAADALALQLLGVDPAREDTPQKREEALRAAAAKVPAAERRAYAADLRLRGQVLDVTVELAGAASSAAIDEAIATYRLAIELDPAQVEAAARLAALYRERKGSEAEARQVLDDLVKASDGPAAQMALARFLEDAARDRAERGRGEESEALEKEADAALDRAAARAPKDAEVRLQVAEAAARRGRVELARRHLAALPAEARSRAAARAIEGLLALHEDRIDAAIEAWRQGLVEVGGVDAEMTWRLAFTLLQRGRAAEARPYVEQFRRLAGSEQPTVPELYLRGLEALKQNKPADAIGFLEPARLKAMPDAAGGRSAGGGPGLAPQVLYTLGQAYEAVRDEPAALEQYAAAARLAPKLAAPRLARVRLLLARRPDEAEVELRRALDEVGADPGLLLMRARLEFRRQVARGPERRQWAELLGLIDRARKVAPAAPGLALMTADYLGAAGKADEALDVLERAARHSPASVELWLARAERLARAGRVDQALLVLEQAAAPEAAGDQADLRIARARLMTLWGQGREAREMLVRDLEKVPDADRPRLWGALGDLYAAQGNAADARKAYGKWAEIASQDPMPRLYLLEQALEQGDEAEVARTVEQLRKISGEKGLYYRVARVQELLRGRPGEPAAARDGRLVEAEAMVRQVEADAPQMRYAYMLRGRLEELRGRPDAAARAYEAALAHDGGPAAVLALTRLYAQLGRVDDLRRLRREHAADVPGLARAEAELLLRQGRKDKAAEMAREVLDGDPDSLDARVWYAKVLNTLGQPEQAEQALQGMVERHPEDPGPWMALLFFQAGRKRAAEAAATVERARRQVKGLDRPEFFYAQCWRIAGDRAKADAAYAAALAKWPADPRVVRGAADYYEATGRPGEAETLLRGLLKADPSQRWAARALALLLSARPAAWAEAWGLVGADVGRAALPEERLVRALVLARGPDPWQAQDAAGQLRGLLADLPADLPVAAAARTALAQMELRRGDPKAAVPLARAAATAGAAAPAVALYAEALLAAKDLDEADRQLTRLEAMAAGDLGVVLLRARWQAARGRPDDAAALLEKAFADREKAPEARVVGRVVLGRLLDLDRPRVAERVAARMAALWPETSWMGATVAARQGRVQEAFAGYRDALARADAAALRDIAQDALALAQQAPGDASRLAAAEEILARARRREPGSADLMVLHAVVRHLQGRYDDEVALYREAIKSNPGDYRFLNNMAWTLCENLHDPKAALEAIDQAVRRTGEPLPQYLDTRGVVLTRLGRFDDAIRDLERAASVRPSGPTLARLARAYRLAGRLDRFRAARDRARQAGLKPDQLDPSERGELEPLIFGPDATAAK